jgi:hypothetical protein
MAVVGTHGCVPSYSPSVEPLALPLNDHWPDYFPFRTLAVLGMPGEFIPWASKILRPYDIPYANHKSPVVNHMLQQCCRSTLMHIAVDTLAEQLLKPRIYMLVLKNRKYHCVQTRWTSPRTGLMRLRHWNLHHKSISPSSLFQKFPLNICAMVLLKQSKPRLMEHCWG